MSISKRLIDAEYGSSEEVAEKSVEPSMSQDELITEFWRLDTLAKESYAAKNQIAMQLAAKAWEERDSQDTVHLQSTDGRKVKVVFGHDTEYVTAELMTVSEMLGREQFDELFESKIEFKPKKRALKLFMNTVAPDERIKTAKQMIKDATMVKPKSPYVSVER